MSPRGQGFQAGGLGADLMRISWPLLSLLAATSSVGVAQAGPGKRGAPPTRFLHHMVAPDSVKWEAPPAGMFRGPPPTDTTSHWRYARLEGDPLKSGAPYTIKFRCSDGS